MPIQPMRARKLFDNSPFSDKEQLSVGADPEMFASDEAGNIRSVIGLIGGTKHNPRPVGPTPGFFVQEDNVALEFNIPAATTKASFVNNIQSGVKLCEDALKVHGLRPHIAGSVRMPDSELQNNSAFEFGCNPFLNAWTLDKPKQLSPDMLANPADRFAAGHVHIGIPSVNSDPFLRMKWVRMLDFSLAVPALMWMTDEELEQERVRRTMYGKAGSYRHKSYGVEYISLSNFWIKRPETIGAVWDAIWYTYSKLSPKRWDKEYKALNAYGEELCEHINNCNRQAALKLADKLLGVGVMQCLVMLPQLQINK